MSLFKSFSKEIIFNLIKYSSNIINYCLKKNMNVNWKLLYNFLFKFKNNTKIPAPHTYPYNKENKWLNAIINKHKIKKDIDYDHFKLLKNGQVMESKIHLRCLKFELMKNINNVYDIISSQKNVVLLLNNGQIMFRGNNYFDPFGLGYSGTTHDFKLIKVNNIAYVFGSLNYIILLLGNGQTMICGFDKFIATDFEIEKSNTKKLQLIRDKTGNIIKNVINVFCGDSNIFLLLKNRTIMACGENKKGQIGLGDMEVHAKFELVPEIFNVKKIVVDYFDSVILLENGQIMSCVFNNKYKFKVIHKINDVIDIFYSVSGINIMLKNKKILLFDHVKIDKIKYDHK